MPAAAVIPAPIAYIKVVAVKKLVVGSRIRASGPPRGGLLLDGSGSVAGLLTGVRWSAGLSSRSLTLWTPTGALDCGAGGGQDVYFEKIRVFQAGVLRPNNGAWNNGIGSRFYFVGSRN